MRHGNRRSQTGHAFEEQAGGLQHFHHGQASFKTLAVVVGEAWPVLGARNDVGQLGKHLAAIAYAQAKGIAALEKRLKLSIQAFMERDAACPSHTGTQGVAVAETAASHQALKVFEVGPALLQIGHVNVVGLKTGLGEGVGHLHMGVHALLSQHRHTGLGLVNKRRCNRVVPTLGQMQVQTGVRRITRSGVFLVSSKGVVTLTGNLPADAVPYLLQVLQRSRKYLFGVTPHADHRRCAAKGFANHMAVG